MLAGLCITHCEWLAVSRGPAGKIVHSCVQEWKGIFHQPLMITFLIHIKDIYKPFCDQFLALTSELVLKSAGYKFLKKIKSVLFWSHFSFKLRENATMLCTPTKQGTSNFLGIMNFSIIVRNILSALIWHQNQVHIPPTFWDLTICV